MSDFLHRLQERITAAKNAKFGLGPSHRIDHENSSHGSRLSQLKNYLMQAGQGKQFALPTVKLKPDQASKGLTSLLMMVFACTLTYWAMRIIQVPGAPSLPALGMSKGVTLYIRLCLDFHICDRSPKSQVGIAEQSGSKTPQLSRR